MLTQNAPHENPLGSWRWKHIERVLCCWFTVVSLDKNTLPLRFCLALGTAAQWRSGRLININGAEMFSYLNFLNF